MLRLNKLLAGLGAALLLAAPLHAAEFEVQMLNSGEAGRMVFEPSFLEIAPGDTVIFKATDKGHNAETINGMIPEGAEPFKGAMGKDVTVTFDVEGAYGIKCLPHYAMGMVALIVVGENPANLEEAKAVNQPPMAQQRFDAAFAELGAQ